MGISRWKIIAIFISIAWAFGAGNYQRNYDHDKAEKFTKWAYRICTDTKALANDPNLTSCDQEREKDKAIWMQGSWGNVAFIALAPIPLALFAAFILFYVGKVGIVGFRAVVPWSSMPLLNKGIVVVSLLTCLSTFLAGVVVVMNLYVDTIVTVSLVGEVRVSDVGDDIVYVQGTWVREGSRGQGSKMASPLQKSNIRCQRSEKRCYEARALVGDGVLDTELWEYEIESWSSTTIMFRNDSLCAEEVFTIDRKTQSVNGVGLPINLEMDNCKRFQISEDRESKWSYHLADGFNVYWAERQKARPIFLRMIHTLFGN